MCIYHQKRHVYIHILTYYIVETKDTLQGDTTPTATVSPTVVPYPLSVDRWTLACIFFVVVHCSRERRGLTVP